MNLLHAIGSAVVIEAAPPAARTTTFLSAAIDSQAYEGSFLAILSSAAGTGTTPTLDGKIQSSVASGGTYADVAGATFTQVTDAGDTVEGVQVDTGKADRFIKFSGTIAGGTPSFTFGVVLVGLNKYR